MALPQDAGFHILIQYIKVFKRRMVQGYPQITQIHAD
jgi:hypothetical protein